MPHERTSKTLSERIDVGFHRRPSRFRRWRFQLSLWATVLCVALVVLAEAGGSRTIYQAGPLATAHQMLANDCHRCHSETWKPLERLVTLDDRLVSTPDHACKECHAGPVHHEDQLTALTQCADCHREHRGRKMLSRVADGYCKQCHDDLKTTAGPTQNFVPHVPSFKDHPEFAVLRSAAKTSPDRPKHKLHEVAEAAGGVWHDKAKIRLNHKVHMNPLGIIKKPGSTELKIMKCEDCHQPDASRRYMQPIKFEQHCGECHANQLRFENDDFHGDVGQLPHSKPEIVRGVLRDRLTQFILKRTKDEPQFLETKKADANKTSADDTDAALPRFFPTQQPAEKLSREQWDWVSGRMFDAEGLLFSPSHDGDQKARGCAYCHQVKNEDSLVQITEPKIPERWLLQSRFQHDSHRLVSCTECHGKALTGTDTKDIMLPGVESCRKCHGGDNRMAGAARADCVECHAYHHREGESFNGPLSIDTLRGGELSRPRQK